MTERSRFWDGTTLGDATDAPYSASEFSQVMLGMLAQNNVSPWQRSFVGMGAGYGVGSLLVTGTATPVSIAAGTAVVAGMWYENDAATTLAVSTPGANPRRDRVVLRASWASQTIRLALLAGVEAATPTAPALTQTFGTTWEVSLATVYITTGGVITVTDERVGNIGLGNSVLFRDIANRWQEEFFDHFIQADTASGSIGQNRWSTVVVGSATVAKNSGPPTSFQISSSATANSSLQMGIGNPSAARFQHELNQAPILIEMRAQIATAVDAQGTIVMRLMDSAGTSYIEYGMRGSVSTTHLMIRDAAGGAATSFTTGQAVDTAAYHTYGIYVPASGGPAVALYDGAVIGQIAGNIPAATTDMAFEFFAGNGTTAAARTLNIDWVRLVRGTA